jgi:hypothetical protein
MAKRKTGLDWILQDRVHGINYLIGYDNKKLIDFYHTYKTNHNNANDKEILWGYYNFLILDISKSKDNKSKLDRNLSSVYGAMHRFRSKYENKRDDRLIQLRIDKEIESYQCNNNVEGYEMEIEIISNKCCAFCDSIDSKRFNLDYAKKNRIIDVSKCKNEWGFKGTVAIVTKRDSDGNLIPKEQNNILKENSNPKKSHQPITAKSNKSGSGCMVSLLPIIAFCIYFIIRALS